MEAIQLNINNESFNLSVKKNWTLMHVLREILNLTGAKCGCATGDCGACKVIIDGEAVNSCLINIMKAVGKKIVTIEGIAELVDGEVRLHPIQQAYIDAGAVQCGFCTPGMIMSTKALLDKNLNPTREQITDALENNLCRCTGYKKIIEAVELAASRMRGVQ